MTPQLGGIGTRTTTQTINLPHRQVCGWTGLATKNLLVLTAKICSHASKEVSNIKVSARRTLFLLHARQETDIRPRAIRGLRATAGTARGKRL